MHKKEEDLRFDIALMLYSVILASKREVLNVVTPEVSSLESKQILKDFLQGNTAGLIEYLEANLGSIGIHLS